MRRLTPAGSIGRSERTDKRNHVAARRLRLESRRRFPFLRGLDIAAGIDYRHLRGLFKRAAVFQIRGDARGAKGVVADMRGDAAGFRAPLNHRVAVVTPNKSNEDGKLGRSRFCEPVFR
jgi:hypothetical protein